MTRAAVVLFVLAGVAICGLALFKPLALLALLPLALGALTVGMHR